MTTDQRLKECVARCTANNEYLDTFYRIFLSRSEKARERFVNVDMDQQKQRLAKALPRLLAIADIDPQSRVAQETREAHRGRHKGGPPTDYAAWIESLCETFKHHDKLFDDELQTLLTERLRRSVRIINPEAKIG